MTSSTMTIRGHSSRRRRTTSAPVARMPAPDSEPRSTLRVKRFEDYTWGEKAGAHVEELALPGAFLALVMGLALVGAGASDASVASKVIGHGGLVKGHLIGIASATAASPKALVVQDHRQTGAEGQGGLECRLRAPSRGDDRSKGARRACSLQARRSGGRSRCRSSTLAPASSTSMGRFEEGHRADPDHPGLILGPARASVRPLPSPWYPVVMALMKERRGRRVALLGFCPQSSWSPSSAWAWVSPSVDAAALRPYPRPARMPR